jgi:hypothetical protein
LRYEKLDNSYRVILTEEPSDSVEFFLDTMTKTFPREARYLPIIYYGEARKGLENNKSFWPAGLVIQPTGDFPGEYRRLKVFRMTKRVEGSGLKAWSGQLSPLFEGVRLRKLWRMLL